MIDATCLSKGRSTECVEDVGPGVAVVPAVRVFRALDAGDPLLAGEGVGFVPDEEGELGEVSLTKIFDLIGYCVNSKIKEISLQISLKIFELRTKCLGKDKSSKQMS